MTDAVTQDRFGRVLGLYSTPGLRVETLASVVFGLDLDLFPSLLVEPPDAVVGHFYELTITHDYCLTVNHDNENQPKKTIQTCAVSKNLSNTLPLSKYLGDRRLKKSSTRPYGGPSP